MILIPLFAGFLVFVIAVIASVVSLVHKYRAHTRYQAELRQWHAQNPDPRQPWVTQPPARPSRSVWSTAGTVLAAITAMGGLTILAMTVLLFVALSSGNVKFGNK